MPTKTNRWLNNEFESSTGKTEEFKAFVRDFRSDIKTLLKNTDWTLHSFCTGHFYISGFIINSVTGEFMYFSISDVRFFKNDWSNKMLIRTASHAKDYTGGRNQYVKFLELDSFLNQSKNY